MNIVIPMAGLGSRFAAAGYQIPKPFIPIKGKPMIEHVIDNISTPQDKVYLVMLLEHMHYLTSTNLLHQGNVAIIPQNGRMQGAAKSVLLAREFINNDEPLVIANSDQYVVYDKDAWAHSVEFYDGSIMTFPSSESKWSYAEVPEDFTPVTGAALRVLRVAEKQVISNHATVGVYGYKKGSYFVEAAEKMINKKIMTNNEFYVCPAFNEMVMTHDIRTFPIDEMYGMGTPEDLALNYNHVGE